MTDETKGAGHKEGYVRTIWLHLCKEGGMWTPAEVAPLVNLGREHVARVMHNMVARGGQLVRKKVNGRCQFGVTQDCSIPYGITVRQLIDAGAKPNSYEH